MSIISQQYELESFSDDMLQQEAKQPTGRYPMFLVASEIERRKELRDRYQAQQYKANQPSIVDQRLQEMMGGIPSADPGMNVPGPPNPQMQQGIAQFAGGGLIGYQDGGQVPDPWWKRDIMSGLGIDETAYEPFWSKYLGLESVFPFKYDYLGGRDDDRDYAWDVIQSGTGSVAPPSIIAGQPVGGGESRPTRNQQLRDWAREEVIQRAGGPGRQTEFEHTPGISAREPLDPYDVFGLEFTGEDPMLGTTIGELREGVDALDTGPYEERLRAAAGRTSEALRGAVRDESEYEDLLRENVKSPEDIKRHKMALIASGLGALIGGSANLGDIPRGMAPLTREVMSEGERMEKENLQMQLEAAKSQESREAQNLQYEVAAEKVLMDSESTAANMAIQAASAKIGGLGQLVNALNSRANRDVALNQLRIAAIQTMDQMAKANQLTMAGAQQMIGSLQRSLSELMGGTEADDAARESIVRTLEQVSNEVYRMMGGQQVAPADDELPLYGRPVGPAPGT